MMCDVSGSMEPYARALLALVYCAAGRGPPAEAFVFATRLTRITRVLAGRTRRSRCSAREGRARLVGRHPDRRGAEGLFIDGYGRRGLARGAVVVIVSDGWESGDPALVGREMERLSRLAYRIVWVNPRRGAPGYAPLAGGMEAALPHCDAFVSGHSYEALDAVVDAIGGAPVERARRPRRPTSRRRGRARRRCRAARWRCRAGTGRAAATRRPGWVTDE